MAKELYHGTLTKHDDWSSVTREVAGQEITLPAAGDAVQGFIKEQFDTKFGCLYNYKSGSTSQYWAFADTECRDNYLKWLEDKTNPDYEGYGELCLAQFDAPAPFTASINILRSEADGGQTVSTILSTQTNNYIYFKFAIKDTGGTETMENVNAVITFTNNGAVKTWRGQFTGGKIASILVDDYITTGTNTVNITIEGTSAVGISTKTSFDITVVELNLTSSFEFYKSISREVEQVGVPFNIIGAGTKFVEWFIDGECVDDGKDSPIVSANYSETHQIDVYNLASGKHTLQIRSYESINNDKFYGDTVYFDFYIQGNNEIAILLSGIMPGGKLVGSDTDMLELLTVNGYQFEKNTLRLATYDYQARTLSVDISVNNKLQTSISTTNNAVKTWEYTPSGFGTQSVKLETSITTYGVTDEAEANLSYVIEKSNLNISEYTGGIVAKFIAKGRSNDESTKNVWEYVTPAGKHYNATFNNVRWNNLSGWANDALVLSNGATVTFDFNPFTMVTTNGFTFEIEFETADLKSDNVNIMKFGGKNVASYISINGTSASMSSKLGTTVSTNYKDGERMKLAFVVNSTMSKEAKNLMWIINNGVLERSAAYTNDDSFDADPDETTFTIGNTDGDVTVKIYAIRIFQTALTTQQEFSNFAIDSNNIAGNVTNNDVFEADDTTVSLEKVRNKIPVMVITGDMPKLTTIPDKKTPVIMDVEYTHPDYPEYNFILKNAYITKQGTSSLKYPCPNLRIYTQKDESTTLQLPNLPGFEDTVFTEGNMYYTDTNGVKRHPQTNQPTKGDILYSFKPNALPVKVWTIKADYAESSMSHNTGTARWFNNINKEVEINDTINAVTKSAKLCKTAAQAAVEANNYKYHDAIIDKDMETYPFDIRTTIDGFPICVFYRLAAESENAEETKLVFMGLFNFNNDKSSTDIFGFKKIEMYVPDEVDADGNALTLKKKKIFDNSNVFCWEGSANEEAIGKFISTKFDMGTEDANGNPCYDYDLIDNRNIFAAYETRYPDAKDVELADGNNIPGDMFNNTASIESLVRWINYTKQALDLRVYNTSGNTYEDGYTLQAFTEATAEQIEDAKQSNKATLYIKTSIDSEGTTATYESTTYLNGAVYKTITVTENNKEVKKYVDAEGNILADQNDITKFVNIQTYYTKRNDIDFENVEKHVWTADEGHTINDLIYTGWVMNWQGHAIQQLEGTMLKGNVPFAAEDYMTFDDYTKGTCSDHNVEVFLTKVSDTKYTYVDGYGKTREYTYNSNAVKGQYGAVKVIDYRGKTLMDFFAGEYSNHFDIYKLASYYIYTKRFATVDQMVKNIMLTTEDGQHWYYIHYDNDTINGVRNDSLIKYKWDVTRETYDLSLNAYAYAGFQSVLWNNLENCKQFMKVVRSLDSAMAHLPVKNGEVNALTFDGACFWYDTQQVDKWCERLYNSSEDYKYISPYIENPGNRVYLAFLQGTRKSHRHWWLRHRFDLIDSEWVSGEYSQFYIGCYAPSAVEGEEICTFKAASDFYFGWMTNTEIRESGTFVKADEYHTFRTPSNLGVGDPIRILAPYQISELDFSNCSGQLGSNMFNIDGDGKAGSYIATRGTQLKKLIIGNYTSGSSIKNVPVEQISSLNLASQLQWLNIQNCTHLQQNIDIHECGNLHIYECEGSATTSFYPANGSILYKVELPSVTVAVDENTNTVARKPGSSISNIVLEGVTFDFDFKFEYNPEGNKDGYFKYTPDANLKTIVFSDVNGDFDSYEFVKKWYNSIASLQSRATYNLTLSGINWGKSITGISTETNREGIPAEFVIALKKAGFGTFDMQGYVYLESMTYAQYREILELYGNNVFNTSGSLVFDAPTTQFLFTDIADEEKQVNIVSGSEVKVRTIVFPLDETDDISYRLYVNGSSIETKDADGNYISDNFKLNPKTGLLQVAERTINTYCKIAARVVHTEYDENGTPKVTTNLTKEVDRIAITARGVTLPKGFKFTTGSTPLTLEAKSSEDYTIELTPNNVATDTTIDYVNFEILNGSTLVTSGKDDVHTDYVSAKYIKETNTVTIYREKIPTSDVTYNVVITPVFKTTQINNTKGSITISVTAVSVIPSYFNVSYDTSLNEEGINYIAYTANEYNNATNITADIVGIKSGNKLTGFKIRKAGKYHFTLKYYAQNGVESSEGVVVPNITAEEFDSWNLKIDNVTIDGFDVTMKQTTNLANPTVITAADLKVNIGDEGGGNGVLVKNGEVEKRIYMTNGVTSPVEADYTLYTGIFITYPTLVTLAGTKTINLNWGANKTVDFVYDVKALYSRGAGELTEDNITVPYTITTTIKEAIGADVARINTSNETGCQLIVMGKEAVGTTSFTLTSHIESGAYSKVVETPIVINYTSADANCAADMELGKFYYVDNNRSMYKIDNADGITSSSWDAITDENIELVGVAMKWNSSMSIPTEDDKLTGDQVFAITLNDIIPSSRGLQFAYGRVLTKHLIGAAADKYKYTNGREITEYLYNQQIEAESNTDTVIKRVSELYADNENINCYVGSFIEYVYVFGYYIEAINKIMEAVGGDKLVYSERYEGSSSTDASKDYHSLTLTTQISNIIIKIDRNTPANTMLKYSTGTTIFDSTMRCRPMIYID